MKPQVVTQPRWDRQPPRGERGRVRLHACEQLSPGGARLMVAPRRRIMGDRVLGREQLHQERRQIDVVRSLAHRLGGSRGAEAVVGTGCNSSIGIQVSASVFGPTTWLAPDWLLTVRRSGAQSAHDSRTRSCPLSGLANAGVRLTAETLRTAARSPGRDRGRGRARGGQERRHHRQHAAGAAPSPRRATRPDHARAAARWRDAGRDRSGARQHLALAKMQPHGVLVDVRRQQQARHEGLLDDGDPFRRSMGHFRTAYRRWVAAGV